jgi:peptidoglycan/xylan/chitin deacetylase (PgdA/CDA1 family)
LNVGLTVDAAGTPSEQKTLLELLKDLGVKATFFVRPKVQSEITNLIYGNGHEIGSHTYSHPVLPDVTFDVKEFEIKSAHIYLLHILNQKFKDVEIKGFRAPYYIFDAEMIKILESINYLWDNTRVYSPILGSNFNSERYGKIIEIPSLFPDDGIMYRRMNMNEKQVYKIWKKSYDLSEDVFIWCIHPYIILKNENRTKILKEFIEYMIEKNAKFSHLSEIAHEIDAA